MGGVRSFSPSIDRALPDVVRPPQRRAMAMGTPADILDLLGIELPVIQAPMAGATTRRW